MFTGLVAALATVADIKQDPPGIRLVIDDPLLSSHVSVGDSLAINGCCLTVVEVDGSQMHFEAGSETLSRTNLGELQVGSQVNLESSVRAGEPMGGHFVMGHIDCVGHVLRREDEGEWSTMWFRVPAEWTREMVAKGSIAVDGVSLTLVEVQSDSFSVALIPHTLTVTTLGRRTPGDRVNIETDVLAKYVQKAVMSDPSR